MIKHKNKKLNDPYTTDSIQKEGKRQSGTQKRKKFTNILGCVECSTNGDSLGVNKNLCSFLRA
jgi:hypothetical protein